MELKSVLSTENCEKANLGGKKEQEMEWEKADRISIGSKEVIGSYLMCVIVSSAL